MQNIVIDKPYRFVPPRHGRFWPSLIRFYLPAYLRKEHGIESTAFGGLEHLKASLEAGHGIMLAPNHCRPCDPMVVGLMASSCSPSPYVMASWHLFMQPGILPWLLPRLGAFSVYREGLDREALKCAVQILTEARRPLVVLPEGVISRTNDRLSNLMEGTAFIARNAAKQRANLSPPGRVVVHPVAIRYFFCGDIDRALAPVLRELEKRLSWVPRADQSSLERIRKVGQALLVLKELECFGTPGAGTLAERLSRLIDHLLVPLEDALLKGKRPGDVISRVKTLRAAILPDMVAGDLTEEERVRRWRQLADLYLAQQLFFYPPDYFSPAPSREQMLETVERFEEDLTDQVRVYRPMHVAVEVGPALEVSPTRDRAAPSDPLMMEIRSALESMLARLKENGRPQTTGSPQ